MNEEAALREIPVLHLLSLDEQELRTRASSLAEKLRAVAALESVDVAEDIAYVGGGSLPDQKMKTWIVVLKPRSISDADFAQRLRVGNPAVMGRVRDGKVVLDVRTVFPRQIEALVEAIGKALA
jgi:L-seryl-tRNA(Ser) seleniumtransferase